MVGGPRIGIDFGTSHTVAMCQWRGGPVYPLLFDASPLLPSAVFAGDTGLLVGRDAERSARLDPGAFEPYPKRRVDDGSILLGATEYPVVDVIAAVLRRCLDEGARVSGQAPEQVVLTHPANWGPQRKAVLSGAAERAGVTRVGMVSEPVAAAVYFTQVMGLRVGEGGAVVFYDFGGGTFDVAVVRRRGTGWDVMASDGLDDVGGVDLDGVLIDGLRANLSDPGTDGWSRLTNPRTAADRRHRRLLWDDARAAKEQLSRNPAADVHIPIHDTDVRITRAEFEQQARPWLERTVAVTASTVSRSGVTREQVAGVFLVGGSSRIPIVATLLHQRLGIAPTVIEQPELVVAQGSLNTVPEHGVESVQAVARGAPAPDSANVRPAIGMAVVPPPVPVSPPVSVSVSPSPVSVSPSPVAADGDSSPPTRFAGRGRMLVVAGAVLLLILAAATWFVVFRDRTPALTAQGEQNAAVFKSSQLRSFARRWLNDVRCTSQSPNAGSIETVTCAGDRWSVNFRAYSDVATRNQIREQRRASYDLRGQQNLTGRGPRSGVRVDYVQDNQYQVIYWDAEGPPVSGDLFSIEIPLADLALVWNTYVQ